MKPAMFLRFDGVGDSLLTNTIAFHYARENSRRVFVATTYPELYRGTPGVTTLPTKSPGIAIQMAKFLHRIGVVDSLVYLSYQPSGPDAKMRPLPGHILSVLAAKVGLQKAPTYPVLFLSQQELELGALPQTGKPWIAMQSTGITAMTSNKNWFPERFEALARQVRKRFRIVQLGLRGDPPLESDLDLRNRTTPRQAAVTLASCRAVICQEGYLMHAATAVGTPAVVIFGGFISPMESGYAVNENLFTELSCSPCWLRTDCPYDKECMRRISTEDVLTALEKLLASRKSEPTGSPP
jgi:ADP-heptose:LPS heptosyltransferase